MGKRKSQTTGAQAQRAKKRRRDLRERLLGFLNIDEDGDDEDYVPDTSSAKAGRARSSKTRAAPDGSGSDSGDTLAARLSRMTSKLTPAASGTSMEAAGGNWTDLPQDVLQQLVQAVCRRAALPMAPRLARVCRSWRDAVATTPELWQVIELRPPLGARPHKSAARPPGGKGAQAALMRCITSGRWAQLRELRVRAGCALTHAELRALAPGCPRLSVLDLSGWDGGRAEELEASLLSLTSLEALVLNDMCVAPAAALDKVVRLLLVQGGGGGGPRLQRLVAQGIPLLGRQVLRALSLPPGVGAANTGGVEAAAPGDSAPTASSPPSSPPAPVAAVPGALPLSSLRELDLSGSGSSLGCLRLHIEYFQAACPALEVLVLSGLGSVMGWQPVLSKALPRTVAAAPAAAPPASAAGHVAAAPSSAPAPAPAAAGGWPQLRVLAVASATTPTLSNVRGGLSFVDDDALQRMARNSPRLTDLDVSGTNVSAQGLRLLCAVRPPLERLHISKSPLSCDEGVEAAMKLFGDSLQELVAANAGSSITDTALQALAAASHLRTLDLSGSSIMDNGLVQLMASAAGSSLTELNVASCRSLERSTRHAAAAGLTQLRQHLAL